MNKHGFQCSKTWSTFWPRNSDRFLSLFFRCARTSEPQSRGHVNSWCHWQPFTSFRTLSTYNKFKVATSEHLYQHSHGHSRTESHAFRCTNKNTFLFEPMLILCNGLHNCKFQITPYRNVAVGMNSKRGRLLKVLFDLLLIPTHTLRLQANVSGSRASHRSPEWPTVSSQSVERT